MRQALLKSSSGANLHSLTIYELFDDDECTLSQQFANLECLRNLRRFDVGYEVHIDIRIVLEDIGNALRSLKISHSDHNLEGLTFNSLVELELYNHSNCAS
eukprot:1079238_1